MPLFSVITITKNNPIGFERTKRSLESQLCKDYEWVVVDGDVEPDNGIYDAMNKGIDRSSGEFLVFMNAGDEFFNSKSLQLVKDIIEGNSLIYGDAQESGFIKKARHNIAHGLITHHQAIYYKRDVVGDLRYDLQYPIAADYKFTAEFIKKISSQSIQYIDHPLCVFEVGGLSTRQARQGRIEQRSIRRELGIYAPMTPYRQAIASWVRGIFEPLYFLMQRLTK